MRGTNNASEREMVRRAISFDASSAGDKNRQRSLLADNAQQLQVRAIHTTLPSLHTFLFDFHHITKLGEKACKLKLRKQFKRLKTDLKL